jgi:hypothetical protein
MVGHKTFQVVGGKLGEGNKRRPALNPLLPQGTAVTEHTPVDDGEGRC